MEKVVTYEDWVEKVITYEDWMEIKASKSNCHPSDASATFTPTILESDKSKSIITDSPETSNEPKRKITPTVLNPFNSTWALVKQYSSFCFPGDSASNAFGVCPLLTKLWQCCDAICETKVRYKNGASDLGYVNNKWGEVMAHLNELCSLICPPETPFFTASAPPSLPGIFGTVMALRLAVTQLVQTAPIVKTKPNIKDVRARFQLVNQLWHLRALPQLGSGCGTLCDAKQSGCRNLLQKHEAVLDALWSLLYSAFIVISTRPETLDAKLGEIQVCSFTVQKKQEGEAFEACWRVCEILKTGVVDSLWSKNGDGNELYSKVYSPSEEAMKPTGPGPNARKFEGQQSGKGKTVNEWNQGVEAARKEMDVEEDEGADHSENESTHTPSDISGGKGALDWTMLPTQPVLDSDHEVSVTEPPIASTGDVVAPEEKMTSPKSWDEMVAPPIQEGLVASECNSQDLWQQKVYVAESDATEVKGNPAVNKNQGTSVTQLPVTASASVPRTQPIQVNGGSKSSDADAPGPQKQSEQRPSSLPAKPPSPAAAAPTATPPSTSGTSAKTASNCTRCGNIDAADIEAIHHIRIRILLLHAATARGYSSTNGRKFADFVREMPATSFGDTKAQKKLFNSYRRAVLYSTENIKAKGDTVAHEASVMQVKAAVDWKTQSGKYMFLRELYKHVVGVEIEKMEMLPEKSKATVMTG